MIPAAVHANALRVDLTGINVEITSPDGGWELTGYALDNTGSGLNAYVLCAGNPANSKLNLTFNAESGNGMDFKIVRVGDTTFPGPGVASHQVVGHNLAENAASSIEFTIRASEEETSGAIHLIPARITEVSFGGNSYHELKSDDLSQTYSAPQWQDNDGGAHEQNEKNQSVAYTKATKPEIGAKFNVPGLPATIPVYAQAFLGEAQLIPSAAPCVRNNDIASKPMAEVLQAFPDKICFYPKGADNAYSIRWQLSLDNQQWGDVATTKHQVYVTRTAPAASIANNRETLFYVACDNTHAQNDPEFTVVEKINKRFMSRSMHKVDPGTGKDGDLLTFWATTPIGDHLLDTGNGRCGGWADFMSQVFAVHGIIAAHQEIKAKGAFIDGVASTNPNANGNKAKEFVLNPAIIPNPSGTPAIDFLTGLAVPCQGRVDRLASWPSHSIVKYLHGGKTYYIDPSYGTKICDGMIDYCKLMSGFVNDKVGTVDCWAWKPDDTNEDIVEFTPPTP